MDEMKLINSDCFTATNSVRSAATIAFLVVSLAAVYGEDLTTLDGKTYTNITEFAKYPNQIFFTCNEKRIAVAISNLPEEFRTQHGILAATNSTAKNVTGQQNNGASRSAVDLFLFQNKDTDLMECDSVAVETNNVRKSWQLCLHGIEVHLTSWVRDNDTRKEESQYIQFQIGQEVMANQVFDKYLEWDAIAQTNNAEPFEKLITKYRDLSFSTNYRDLAEALDQDQSFTPLAIRNILFIGQFKRWFVL